jgi:hypothetical protein
MIFKFDPNSPIISLLGMLMDAFGGLYLAYDLLGGKNGPLRVITRVVTYAIFYFVAYPIMLGISFGLIAGIGLGAALGIELSRAGKTGNAGGFRFQFFLAFIRGLTLGFAVWLTINKTFGPLFGFFGWLTLSCSYFFHFTPSEIYTSEKPGLSRRKLMAACYRGLAVVIAGIIAGLIVHVEQSAQIRAIGIGVCVAIASMLVTFAVPVIEQLVDELPPQKLGVLGTILFMLGFCLQAVPYIVGCMHLGIGMHRAPYEH